MKVQSTSYKVSHVVLYVVLIVLVVLMPILFTWTLSVSLKLDRDVFLFPIKWIPENPRWINYMDTQTKIPLAKFVLSTTKLTIIVTILQLSTNSFMAYTFAKLKFGHRDLLFLAYVSIIVVPRRAHMVPQFIMMRPMGANDSHMTIICLQAFPAFGVFMMGQFYQGIPDGLYEAVRIDGTNEYQIWYKIILLLLKPVLLTPVIFAFVGTWNDLLGSMIYLRTEMKETLQIGLRMFIGQYSSEYELIMVASMLPLIPVLVVFLSLQKCFVEGIVATGVKG